MTETLYRTDAGDMQAAYHKKVKLCPNNHKELKAHINRYLGALQVEISL